MESAVNMITRIQGPLISRGAASIAIGLLLALGGCASYTPLPEQTEQQPASLPAPAIPQQEPERAVDRLLQESRSQLAARDWQAAIASAERGLRIDRREAELYLLLAEGYRGLGNADRSVQFARQGLRYAGANSPVARALHNLIATGEGYR